MPDDVVAGLEGLVTFDEVAATQPAE